VATSLFELKNLLSRIQDLQDRRKQIEELRDQYFQALGKNDAAAQRAVLQKADEAGVELFEDLPLSDVKEMAAVQDLAAQLRGDEAYLRPYESALRLFHETPPDELRNSLMEIKRILAELGPELGKAVEERQKAQNAVNDLTRLREQLAKEIAEQRSLLAEARVVDALAALRAMSPETYTTQAAQQIQQAETALADVAPGERRDALARDVQTAKTDARVWFNMLSSNPDLPERAGRIVARADQGLQIAADDLAWLDKLMRTDTPVSGVLTRVAAAARCDNTGRRSTDNSALAEAAATWWVTWHRWANAKWMEGNLPQNKVKDITAVFEQIKLFQSHDNLSQMDHELWLIWYRRVTQALTLARSLAFLQPSAMRERLVLKEGHPGPLGFKPALHVLNDWLVRTDDEVFCLFEHEWNKAYDWLMQLPSAPSPAEDGVGGRKRAIDKAARGREIVAWMIKTPQQPTPPNPAAPNALSGWRLSSGSDVIPTELSSQGQAPIQVGTSSPISGYPTAPQVGAYPAIGQHTSQVSAETRLPTDNSRTPAA